MRMLSILGPAVLLATLSQVARAEDGGSDNGAGSASSAEMQAQRTEPTTTPEQTHPLEDPFANAANAEEIPALCAPEWCGGRKGAPLFT